MAHEFQTSMGYIDPEIGVAGVVGNEKTNERKRNGGGREGRGKEKGRKRLDWKKEETKTRKTQGKI